MSFKNLSWALR